MPILVSLRIDGEAVTMPDPSGGYFNAAGDFDRLLPMENQIGIEHLPGLATLSRIEAYADVEFTREDLAAVAQEAAALLPYAKPGPEARGLQRLRALAEHGALTPGAVLLVQGD